MQSAPRYARSGGISIAYTERGDGTADVVLVPGFVSNVGRVDDNPFLHAILQGVGRSARVVLFDKRGTGLSERAVGVADLETRMDDVRAVMDAVGHDRGDQQVPFESGEYLADHLLAPVGGENR